jgi:uncharacterized membrane protein
MTEAADAARVLGAVQVASGLAVIAAALPLIAGRVPRNRWYGVRIPKAFESDTSWYAINRFGGRWLVVAGAMIAALGVATLLTRPESKPWLVAGGYAPAVILVLVIVPVLRFARRLP